MQTATPTHTPRINVTTEVKERATSTAPAVDSPEPAEVHVAFSRSSHMELTVKM